jgi:SAM-dependent methyltransferase
LEQENRKLVALGQRVERAADFEFIDQATETLGARSLKGNPNFKYLASRLRENDVALLNVKQMGYYIGRLEAERSGIADRVRAAQPPEKALLASKLCTQDDCEADWYAFWLRELSSGMIYHRKVWEFAYICQQLYATGMLEPGRAGVGFGCGEEPLPSLFAKYAVSSVGTDLGPDAEEGRAWAEGHAHASSREKLIRRDICSDEWKLDLIKHAFVNMNHIPREYDGRFDFTWSACALEHVGSIDLALTFIENSLKTLKPGGVAVHTTEYNLDDDGETLDNWPTVLFQRKHVEGLVERLTAKGYDVSPLNLDGGDRVLDGLFDVPPWPWDAEKLGWEMLPATAHIKKSIEGFPCTSIGLTIKV